VAITSAVALKRNLTFVNDLDRSGVREFCIFNLITTITIGPGKSSRAPVEARMPKQSFAFHETSAFEICASVADNRVKWVWTQWRRYGLHVF
jgi:hypothetical protein